MSKPFSDPLVISRIALALAPLDFAADVQTRMENNGVAAAVRTRNTSALYAWMVSLVRLQGVSDRAADAYAAGRADIRWKRIAAALASSPACPRLRSYWDFEGCGYRKGTGTCAEATLLPGCTLPRLDLRKGALNVGAFGLALFARDIARNDLVAWLDDQLEHADQAGGNAPDRARRLRDAVALPFGRIAGIGPKVASMIMADLLIGGDPVRERWVTAGGAMVAVDSLVHNTLTRTGIIDTWGSRHAMGLACYRPGGCAEVIERIAAELSATGSAPISARELQSACWLFASEGGWAICNARQIDDAVGCRQRWCPASMACARLPLR